MFSMSLDMASAKARLADSFPAVKERVLGALRRVMHEQHVPSVIVEQICEYYDECITYTTGGKLLRAILVVGVFETFGQQRNCDDYVRAALELGWCVELLQAFFLVEDDIMDRGKTRRGRPCWYLNPMTSEAVALNDGLFLEHCVYLCVSEICRELRNPELELLLLQIFRDISLRTVIGQHLDTHGSWKVARESLNSPSRRSESKENWNASSSNRWESFFTTERWRTTVTFKTAFYSFVLPVKLGLALASACLVSSEKENAGNTQNAHMSAENLQYMSSSPTASRRSDMDRKFDELYSTDLDVLLVDIGKYFQAQDDYLDVFGSFEVMGKRGTDIAEGKCTWVLVKALEACRSRSLSTTLEDLLKIYVTGDRSSEAGQLETETRVKAMYESLGVPEMYATLGQETNQKVSDTLAKVRAKDGSESPSSLVVQFIWKSIYGRNK